MRCCASVRGSRRCVTRGAHTQLVLCSAERVHFGVCAARGRRRVGGRALPGRAVRGRARRRVRYRSVCAHGCSCQRHRTPLRCRRLRAAPPLLRASRVAALRCVCVLTRRLAREELAALLRLPPRLRRAGACEATSRAGQQPHRASAADATRGCVCPARPAAAAPAAAAPPRKETPAERVKRLMSMQLNQQSAYAMSAGVLCRALLTRRGMGVCAAQSQRMRRLRRRS